MFAAFEQSRVLLEHTHSRAETIRRDVASSDGDKRRMSVARNDRLSACSGGKHGEDTAPGADVESANGFSASVNSINLSRDGVGVRVQASVVAQHVEMILWKTGISLGKVVVFSILYTELNAHGVVRARKRKNHAVFNLYLTGHKLHGGAHRRRRFALTGSRRYSYVIDQSHVVPKHDGVKLASFCERQINHAFFARIWRNQKIKLEYLQRLAQRDEGVVAKVHTR